MPDSSPLFETHPARHGEADSGAGASSNPETTLPATPPASADLEIRVEHRIGRLQLEASFTLRHPWTVLFGPSGAGKSTLLRILAGLIRPDACELRLGSRTLVDTKAGVFVPAGQRQIGFLTQEPALFPHLDVSANIEFGLGGMDKAEQRDRVEAVMRIFHVEELGGRMPATVSGGERQRVGLARALAPEPKLLLLDEPFAALDARLKDGILDDLLPWLQARGIPVLYVSHEVAEAFQTSSDVIAIRDGVIVAQGPATVVLAEERVSLLRRLGVRAHVTAD